MLILGVGPKNKEYQNLRNGFFKEHSGVYTVTSAEMNELELTSFAKTASLFGGAQAYQVSNISADLLISVAHDLALSEHSFLVTTDALLAPQKKSLEKKLADVSTDHYRMVTFAAVAKTEAVSPFGISNLLPGRDRKKLWTTLISLKYAGHDAESVHGILFWKCKDMIAKGVKNPSLEKIMNDMSELVHGYHDNRRMGGDLWNWMEQWVLKMEP